LNILFAPQAIDDLTQHVQYLASRNPDAAVRLAQRALAVIDQLARGAYEGSELELRSGERVRSWPMYPLRIYYRRTPTTLAVLRIYHQARRPIAQ
jgi:plasmid stabilization system protein ParE